MEKKIAIRGHKTRGRDVIRALVGMGGTNEIGFNGTDSNSAYYIRHDFMISRENLDKPPLEESYSLYTIEEYEAYMKNKKEAEHSSAEKLVEDKALKQYEVPTGSIKLWDLPEGYQFTDENGNVINATKIVLEKKKKEYPKTYEECAEIIAELTGSDCNPKGCMGYRSVQLTALQKLLICRDAYWKIAGEEMGLGKSWEINPREPCYYIAYLRTDNIILKLSRCINGTALLAFPTAEMRDAFKENFDTDIEICKVFL